MRPTDLDPLFADATTLLPGIGPKLGKILAEFTGDKIIDLLHHLPANLIDRQYRPPLNEVEDGRIATFEVEVVKHETPPNQGRRRNCPIVFCAAMRPDFCLSYSSMRGVIGWAKPCRKARFDWFQAVLSGFAIDYKSSTLTICCQKPPLRLYRLSSRFIR